MKTIVAIMAVAASAFGQAAKADRLVIPGVGSAGSWTTRIDLVNPSSTPIAFALFPDREPLPCAVSEAPCVRTIPANGAFRLEGGAVEGPLTTLVIDSLVESPADRPTVRARVSLENSPLAAELPVASWNAISGRPRPDVLAFPGARRGPIYGIVAGPTTHVNLVLSVLAVADNGDGGVEPIPFAALVELLDSSGALLASRTVSGCAGGAPCGDVVLHDVIGGMGIGAIEDAQLRVTKTSPDGILWGAAAIVTDGGPVSVVPGWNP